MRQIAFEDKALLRLIALSQNRMCQKHFFEMLCCKRIFPVTFYQKITLAKFQKKILPFTPAHIV